MARYEIRFKATVAKDLRGLPRVEVQAILDRIAWLADNPRPRGSEKLTGLDRYRIRHGAYRIVYEIRDRLLVIVVVKIGHRSHVYREHT